MLDVMIDFETLDNVPTSQILTFGAVKFDPTNPALPMEEFYVRCDLPSQAAIGLTRGDETVAWWGAQSEEARKEAFAREDRMNIEEVIEKFSQFFNGATRIWSHGAVFDVVILSEIYRALGKETPWKFWNARDTRTLFDILPPPKRSTLKHHALEDAKWQAQAVQRILSEIGWKP